MGIARCKLVGEEKRENKRWIPINIRKEVVSRDQGKCVFCTSEENVGLAYRVPKSRGGRMFSFNLVVMCKKCRQNKGHQLVEEFILSPYFQFEVLKIDNPCKDKSMKIKVVFIDGDIMEGEVVDDPNTNREDFYIKVGNDGGKVLVSRSEVKYIEVFPTLSEKLNKGR